MTARLFGAADPASQFRRRLGFLVKLASRQGRNLPRVLNRVPALIIAAGIWILSSQTILPHPKGLLGWDKAQHLLAYTALAAAAGLWAKPGFQKRRPVLALLLTALAASAYGAVDEIHQYFVPGRDCNAWDWVADTLGAFLGSVGILAFLRWREKRSENQS